MARDVIISCAAIQRLPTWLPWAGEAPIVLEWPGTQTASGHASWQRSVKGLRDSDGAMLPRLFRRYRQYLGFDLDGAGRLAVVGFSAGSNSGVRELVKSDLDRARIDFVAAVDGMHPTLSQAGSPSDLSTGYADWPQQMGPFAEAATAAAFGSGGFVGTASQVLPVSSSVAPSSSALAALYAWVAGNSPPQSARLPAAFPPRDQSPVLKAEEPYPVPMEIQGVGDFIAIWYPGSSRRAHALQAWVVVPDILRAFLVPRWGGQPSGVVAGGHEEPALPSPTEPVVSGLPNWTPAIPAGLAAGSLAVPRSQ